VIRTNLSTRPFYNVHAVRVAITVFAAVVLVMTFFNVVQVIRLSASQRALGGQAQAAENEAARLRAEAAQILARVDREELETVADAAREANLIIDQRAFSWTNLFAHFESTLPADVRITEVTPELGEGKVVIGVQARSVEDLDAFIEGLESSGAFRNVLPRAEETMEDNTIQATIEAAYDQPARGRERRR
jgi:hypothetical protein